MDQEQNTVASPEQEKPSANEAVPQLPSGEVPRSKAKTWPIIVGALVLLAIIIGLVVLLMLTGSENVGKIRDIFIIFMALESLIIGIVLVILIVQLSILINLIQNEIKPIMEATNETVNTLKGTSTFISNNLAEPVIKLNEYIAGLKKLLDLLFPPRK
jgi:hypothetical protein